MTALVMSQDFASHHDLYGEDAYRFEETYAIAGPIIYGTSEHAYASARDTDTASPMYSPYHSSGSYSPMYSPHSTANYSPPSGYESYNDSVCSSEAAYYADQTIIKDEPWYTACSRGQAHDDETNLPSVVEGIKPDLNSNPILFPPLSPDDVTEALRRPNIELYEPETSDLPREVRDLCTATPQMQLCAVPNKFVYDNYRESLYLDEQYPSEAPTPTLNGSNCPLGRLHAYQAGPLPSINQCIKSMQRSGIGSIPKPYLSSESSSDDSSSSDDVSEHPRKMKRMNRGQGKNCKLLWQFMVELMNDPTKRHLVDWVDKPTGVFRIIDSAKVAKLWGAEKGNDEMNYEKMSRALRFLRKAKFFVFPPNELRRRLCFKFGYRVLRLIR